MGMDAELRRKMRDAQEAQKHRALDQQKSQDELDREKRINEKNQRLAIAKKEAEAEKARQAAQQKEAEAKAEQELKLKQESDRQQQELLRKQNNDNRSVANTQSSVIQGIPNENRVRRDSVYNESNQSNQYADRSSVPSAVGVNSRPVSDDDLDRGYIMAQTRQEPEVRSVGDVSRKPKDARYVTIDNILRKAEAIGDQPLGDMFVYDSENRVVFNDNYKKSTVRDIPWTYIDLAVENLKAKYVGLIVNIGANSYRITTDNAVFKVNRSTMRFLALDTITDSVEKVSIARQSFLNKYPHGESSSFNGATVKSDELDVYMLVLASELAPKISTDDRLKMIQQELELMTQHDSQLYGLLKSHDESERAKTYGILHGLSYILLDRMGLVQGRVADSMIDIPRALTSEDFSKVVSILTRGFGSDYVGRDKTLERDRRQRRKRR